MAYTPDLGLFNPLGDSGMTVGQSHYSNPALMARLRSMSGINQDVLTQAQQNFTDATARFGAQGGIPVNTSQGRQLASFAGMPGSPAMQGARPPGVEMGGITPMLPQPQHGNAIAGAMGGLLGSGQYGTTKPMQLSGPMSGGFGAVPNGPPMSGGRPTRPNFGLPGGGFGGGLLGGNPFAPWGQPFTGFMPSFGGGFMQSGFQPWR